MTQRRLTDDELKFRALVELEDAVAAMEPDIDAVFAEELRWRARCLQEAQRIVSERAVNRKRRGAK